jgi:hypothetical protein
MNKIEKLIESIARDYDMAKTRIKLLMHWYGKGPELYEVLENEISEREKINNNGK